MTANRIDNATHSDIPALVGLLTELFGIEKDFQPDAEKQVRGLELLMANPEQAVIKIARNDSGKAIGMVSAQLVISTAQGAASAWVEDMVVSGDYRGTGLGRTLLEAALEWARGKGATRAQLLVDMENQPAIGYYRHLGWETTQLQARRIFL
ncbi:diamine N-acetyltransferase [Methylophilaceae bacterium]|nr:diamine N-acetyltransferase [Methylophilaceae bacterium]